MLSNNCFFGALFVFIPALFIFCLFNYITNQKVKKEIENFSGHIDILLKILQCKSSKETFEKNVSELIFAHGREWFPYYPYLAQNLRNLIHHYNGWLNEEIAGNEARLKALNPSHLDHEEKRAVIQGKTTDLAMALAEVKRACFNG